MSRLVHRLNLLAPGPGCSRSAGPFTLWGHRNPLLGRTVTGAERHRCGHTPAARRGRRAGAIRHGGAVSDEHSPAHRYDSSGTREMLLLHRHRRTPGSPLPASPPAAPRPSRPIDQAAHRRPRATPAHPSSQIAPNYFHLLAIPSSDHRIPSTPQPHMTEGFPTHNRPPSPPPTEPSEPISKFTRPPHPVHAAVPVP